MLRGDCEHMCSSKSKDIQCQLIWFFLLVANRLLEIEEHKIMVFEKD